MVSLATIDSQLKKAGCSMRFWGRAEIKELCEILLPGETIHQAVNGQYEAGFAMLVTTDFRVLLVDKKPKYLTLKDIRFDMITELDYANRLMDSTIRIFTPNRELRFTALNTARLRKLFTYTQHKVMEIRNHFMMQQNHQQHLAKNTPPGMAMIQQRYGGADDFAPAATAPLAPVMPEMPDYASAHPYQPDFAAHHNRQGGEGFVQTAVESTEEQLKLAAAMGAAGLRSIVHNGKVIKDYMAVPFTQRWRKRPYGYMKTPITGQ